MKVTVDPLLVGEEANVHPVNRPDSAISSAVAVVLSAPATGTTKATLLSVTVMLPAPVAPVVMVRRTICDLPAIRRVSPKAAPL